MRLSITDRCVFVTEMRLLFFCSGRTALLNTEMDFRLQRAKGCKIHRLGTYLSSYTASETRRL